MKIARLVALLIAGFLVAAGCGEDRGDSPVSTSTGGTGTTATTATTPAESGESVSVALNEWAVYAPSVGAGAVTFEATNEGEVEHELVVLKTDTKAADLEVDGAVAKVEGEELGEASGIAPGDSGELAVELEAGHYILLCNLPGHYQQGMHADLDVQ